MVTVNIYFEIVVLRRKSIISTVAQIVEGSPPLQRLGQMSNVQNEYFNTKRSTTFINDRGLSKITSILKSYVLYHRTCRCIIQTEPLIAK